MESKHFMIALVTGMICFSLVLSCAVISASFTRASTAKVQIAEINAAKCNLCRIFEGTNND